MPINDALQANTQHAVPQNIMDVEFKLIGELTMRQFFYIMVFAAIAYMAWSFNIPSILKWPTVTGSILLGLGFAFVPIEDRGLDEWLVNFFQAVYEENQMIWKKEINPPSAFLHENIAMVKQELITLAPTTSRRKLEQYLVEQTDASDVDPLDIPEKEYREKIHAAYVNMVPAPQTAVAVEAPIEEPQVALPSMAPAPEGEKSADGKEAPTKQTRPKTEEVHPSLETVSEDELIKPRPRAKRKEFQMPTITSQVPLAPITPDRHSGRKFTNLLASGGNIVLPIRGEKVLEIPVQEDQESNTALKAQQLKEYLDQVKAKEGIQVPEEAVPETVERVEEKVELEADAVLHGIQAENEKLMTQIEKLKADLSKSKEQPPEEKKISLQQLIEKQAKKEQTLHEVEEKVQILRPVDNTPGVPAEEVEAETVAIPKVPNVLAGIVKDVHGKGLAGILLIIKNNHGDPVRAIKSNALGQFSISNPLPNGKYKINIDVNKETSLSFDIIDVEAVGKIIPPLEFVGKA